jgi:hypothetical protein
MGSPGTLSNLFAYVHRLNLKFPRSAGYIMHIMRKPRRARASPPTATRSARPLPRQPRSWPPSKWSTRKWPRSPSPRRTRINRRRRTNSARASTARLSLRPRSARSHRHSPVRLRTGLTHISARSNPRSLLLLLRLPPLWRLLRRLTLSLGKHGERPRVSLDDWSGGSGRVGGGRSLAVVLWGTRSYRSRTFTYIFSIFPFSLSLSWPVWP